VLVGVLVYLQVLRTIGRMQRPAQQPTVVEGLRPEAAAQPLNTEVLNDPRYQDLDRSLFDQGRLPVPAPAVRGRPNLF
jgi:hypothetical protein